MGSIQTGHGYLSRIVNSGNWSTGSIKFPLTKPILKEMFHQTVLPLWQILLRSMNSGDGLTLNCDDCFLILEYLAETHHGNGADVEILRTIAINHLSCCPDCRQYYLQRLEQLEEMQKFNDASSQKSQ